MSPCLSPRYYISYYLYKIILILILLLLKQLGYEPAAGLTLHPPPTQKKQLKKRLRVGLFLHGCYQNNRCCSSNDNKLFRRSDSLLLIQHYIYKRHCINCNVQLHSMIAVKDINRYELHFRQFMLMANTVTSLLL